MDSQQVKNDIFSVADSDFDTLALEIFKFQSAENPVYRDFLKYLGVDRRSIHSIYNIPFLPVSQFKYHSIISGKEKPEVIFESSGTTGSLNSRHFVTDQQLYTNSFTKGFKLFYGEVNEYVVAGLLPSYLERGNSSLVYMTAELIRLSGDERSGFFLENYDELYSLLQHTESSGRKTLLLGVTYALLDFAEKYPMQLKNTIVMETGGMKGRKKELTRQEVHHKLKQRLGVSEVHSEYGMTEMLSQAYSKEDGIFRSPPWMKALVRAEDDPYETSGIAAIPHNGIANIIDLANINSCSFLATDDMIRLYPDHSFEIRGRLDNADMRGCSLLYV